MSLNIVPGPIAQDGTRLNVQQDLTAFVEGTTFDNFGLEHFRDAAVAFVVSATEPPATNTWSRALSWFKRGEGVLYHLLMFTPQAGPLSGVTQAKWIAASGSRKEILVEARFPVEEDGGVLRQTGEPYPDVYGVQVMRHGLLVPRVYQSMFTSHTLITAFSDSTSSWLGYWAEHHTDPIFAAKETVSGDLFFTLDVPPVVGTCGWSGHSYLVAYEAGFCPLRVCGYTGPGKLVLREGVNSPAFWTPTGTTFRVTEPEVGFVLQSGGSAGAGALFGFLRPSITHRNV